MRHETDQVAGQLHTFHGDRYGFARAQHFDASGSFPGPFDAPGYFTPINESVASDGTQTDRNALLGERLVALH
jgi:hypothetical protein